MSKVIVSDINTYKKDDDSPFTLDELIELLTSAREHFDEDQLESVEVHVTIEHQKFNGSYGAITQMGLPCIVWSKGKNEVLLVAKDLGY